jgi:hypothetical protein
MGPLDFLIHLLGFLAPAFIVAALVALAARLVLPAASRRGWFTSTLLNFFTGTLVLAAGLWFFGRDGKMATYAALVIAVATTQWLSGRAWRG